MTQKGRWVKFYDLTLSMSREDVEEIPTLEAVMESIIEAVNENGGCSHKYRNDTFSLRIADASLDKRNGVATLLIYSTDKLYPDAVYGKFTTADARHIAKEEDEGASFSAHIMFSLTPEENGSYQVLLEESKYLSRTTLEPYLTYLMRQFCEEEFVHEPSKKTYKVYPRYELVGHISNAMKDSIEKSSLSQITFIKKEKNKKFDDGKYYEEVEHIMRVKIKRKRKQLVPSKDILNRWYDKKPADHSMRVAFRSDKGKEQTVEVNENSNSWDDANVVKMEPLAVEKSERCAEGSLNSAVVKAMMGYLSETEKQQKLDIDAA